MDHGMLVHLYSQCKSCFENPTSSYKHTIGNWKLKTLYLYVIQSQLDLHLLFQRKKAGIDFPMRLYPVKCELLTQISVEEFRKIRTSSSGFRFQ